MTSSFQEATADFDGNVKVAKENIRLVDEHIEQLKEDLRKLQARAQNMGLSLRSN